MRVTIGTQTGSGQLSTANDPVLVIEFHARSGNGSSCYIGGSSVSSASGREIPPGESYVINCALPDIGAHRGSVLLSSFYASISDGGSLDYTALIRGD